MRACAFAMFYLLTVIATAQVFDVTTYGAVGNGSTMNTTAIQAAVDACHGNGSGTVLFPAGNYLTATIVLKSNVTLYIAQGATITGSNVIAHYPDMIPQTRSYTDNYPQKSVFYAEGQHNIAITGPGTFNGQGLSPSFYLDMDHRPYGFRFISCSNIRYDGPTLRNSGFWMMHNFNIDTLVVKNLTIVNHGFGNNDGVNIDGCRAVLVDSIMADSNDDPLVIKTTSLHSSENIEIKNCTVGTYARCFKIGTETNGPVKNVHIHHCKAVQSTLGILGTTRQASCGINLSIVDGGSMENVLVEEISMEGINVPFFIRLGNRARKYTDTAEVQGVGYVHGVKLKNITAVAATNTASSITGIPGYDTKAIAFENIEVTYPGGWPVMSNPTISENEDGKPEADLFGDSLPAAGLYIRHADSIRLNNVCFTAQQADARPEFYFDDVTNIDTADLCGKVDIINAIATATASLFSVYPNPTSNLLHIVGKEDKAYTIALYDAAGNMVYTDKALQAGTYIKIAHLPNGIYLLHLQDGNHKQHLRIVKQ